MTAVVRKTRQKVALDGPERAIERDPALGEGGLSMDASPHVALGIQEVAQQLGVTQRALRFYEKCGLIEPQRVGSARVYSKREIARVQLILRGKRLGFSIREIKEFLDLYSVDPEHREQIQRLIERVRERILDLKTQRTALDTTIEELTQIEAEANFRLNDGKRSPRPI